MSGHSMGSLGVNSGPLHAPVDGGCGTWIENDGASRSFSSLPYFYTLNGLSIGKKKKVCARYLLHTLRTTIARPGTRALGLRAIGTAKQAFACKDRQSHTHTPIRVLAQLHR